MTLNAANVIVSWSQALIDSFTFTKNELVIFKPAVSTGSWWFWLCDALIDWSTERAKTVEQIIGFRVHISRECFSCALTFDGSRNAEGQCKRHRE